MITASIVLYKTNKYDLEKVVNSYNPVKDRLLYLIDNSPEKSVLPDKIINNPFINYIFLNKNVGYGSGHNIALRNAISKGVDYHLILNPDVRFTPDVLPELIDFMDNNPDVVNVLPKVVYPDGTIQKLCKLLPSPSDLIIRRFIPRTKFTSRLDDRYTLAMSSYDTIMNPPCLSGCFMLLRVSTLTKYNILFDPRFFLYLEDFDLNRRLHRVGKTLYYPNVSIVHDHAQSSYKNFKSLHLHITSAIKYFNKYGWFLDIERKTMNRKILKQLNH